MSSCEIRPEEDPEVVRLGEWWGGTLLIFAKAFVYPTLGILTLAGVLAFVAEMVPK
jgi:hypothetical protein